jgi:DinB superfamily
MKSPMEPAGMEHPARALLLAQLDIAWSLTAYHLNGLTTEECLWRPARKCLHVRETGEGDWKADWPEHERYDIGPPSIAWTTWHICFWWRKTLEHVGGQTALSFSEVAWPGSAELVCRQIADLHDRWRALLREQPASDFHEPNPDSWPIPEASFQATAAWLNMELMKNAAEIGTIRFLHAVREK